MKVVGCAAVRFLAMLTVAACRGAGADARGAMAPYNNRLDGQRFSPLDRSRCNSRSRLGEVCPVADRRTDDVHAGLVVLDGVNLHETPGAEDGSPSTRRPCGGALEAELAMPDQ